MIKTLLQAQSLEMTLSLFHHTMDGYVMPEVDATQRACVPVKHFILPEHTVCLQQSCTPFFPSFSKFSQKTNTKIKSSKTVTQIDPPELYLEQNTPPTIFISEMSN